VSVFVDGVEASEMLEQRRASILCGDSEFFVTEVAVVQTGDVRIRTEEGED
jgi:hypothetical protein